MKRKSDSAQAWRSQILRAVMILNMPYLENWRKHYNFAEIFFMESKKRQKKIWQQIRNYVNKKRRLSRVKNGVFGNCKKAVKNGEHVENKEKYKCGKVCGKCG